MDTTAKYVQGKTLRAVIDEKESLRDRLALLPYFVDICHSVGAAHGRGIVHRNLNPSNILIGEYDEAVVIDWSLSKTRGRQDDLADAIEETAHELREGTLSSVKTSQGDIALDPAYLAPELVLGHMEKVNASSDVYALGAILYELLTGAAPYANEDRRRVAACVVSQRPDAVAAREPEAPAELVTICERAMHKEPSARYASAKQMAEELRRYEFAPLVHEASPENEADKYKAVLGAMASVALVLLCVGGVSYLRATRERDGALRNLAYAEQQRVAAEEAQEEMSRELDTAKQARSIAEAERDRANSKLIRIEQELKTAKQALGQVEEALKQQQETTGLGEGATDVDWDSEPPQEELPEVIEGLESDDEIATVLPESVPEATNPPESDTGTRPAGLTREQFEVALSDLDASLKLEETEQGSAVVVRVEEGAVPPGLDVLGFKVGDVITRVNRTDVSTVEEAQKALSRVRNDSGFSIRLIRDGRSAWMRVSVGESTSPEEATAPTTPPEVPVLPQAPADKTIKLETSESSSTPAATDKTSAGS